MNALWAHKRLPTLVLMAMSFVFLNGLPIGTLTVLYPLYLHSLGTEPTLIGRNLSLIGLAGGLALLIAGPVADHLGRRPVLLAGSALMATGSFTLAVISRPWGILLGGLLGTGGLIGGVGRALINASFNPFITAIAGDDHPTEALAGAELAWVSSSAVGALVAGGPAVLTTMTSIGQAAAARLIFCLCGLGALGGFIVLWRVQEPWGPSRKQEGEFSLLIRQDIRPLIRLGLQLGLHGAGVGVFTLLPLWFVLRFGVGTGSIAACFSAAQFLSLVCIPAVPLIVRRYGIAKSAAGIGALASACVGLMALASTMVIAAILYAGRSIFNGMLWPIQNALIQQSVAPAIRATATSTAMGAWTLGTILFALLTGKLLSTGNLVLALEMGAVLFAISAVVVLISWLPPSTRRLGVQTSLR